MEIKEGGGMLVIIGGRKKWVFGRRGRGGFLLIIFNFREVKDKEIRKIDWKVKIKFISYWIFFSKYFFNLYIYISYLEILLKI